VEALSDQLHGNARADGSSSVSFQLPRLRDSASLLDGPWAAAY
jgi:hypothetical protein